MFMKSLVSGKSSAPSFRVEEEASVETSMKQAAGMLR
jgi:hypothetical protein